MWRSKIKEGEKFHNLHTTKLAAYRYTLKNGLRYTDEPHRATTSLKRSISNLRK